MLSTAALDTPTEFESRVRDLLQLACPTEADRPFFNSTMAEALAVGKGRTWIEGLQYVIERRRTQAGSALGS